MRDRHSSCRLTIDDERRALDAIRAVLADWTRISAPRQSSDRNALIRIGAHAIGCSTDDLRTVEISWLGAKADELTEEAYR